MAKYRKKPVVIEAFQYDGDLMGSDGKYYVPDWAVKAFEDRRMYYSTLNFDTPPCELFIDTDWGVQHVMVGYYVVKDEDGKLWAYKPDVFERNFEIV